MSEALVARGLVKRFGDFAALDGVDLNVAEGSIFGFLGPNGAGKTTLLRVVTGLARQTAGEVRVFGHEPGSAQARSLAGFLPDVPGFYEWMNAEEFLRFSGSLFDLDRNVLDERVPLLLDLAGLSGVRSRIRGFSRGMKQRLGVAQALVNAPKLLLLDEPTSALDPLGRKDVLDMIASLSGRTTVFFSTHILADVERVCDTVAILDRGRVVTQASVEELKSRFSAHALEVQVAGDPEPLRRTLSERNWLSGTESERPGCLRLSVSDIDAARREVPAAVAQLGLSLISFGSGEVSLEDVFVDLVGQGSER